jgi:hypothetical protein
MVLPPELVLMITSYLDDAEKTAFSLTCRTFYQKYPSGTSLSSKKSSAREKLLCCLERDTPSVYFCHQCMTLHRWYRSWFGDHSQHGIRFYLPTRSCHWRYQAGPDPYSVPYSYARIVMNAHFYGPRHGVPAKKLDRVFQYHSGKHISCGMDCRARVLNGRLLLCSTTTINHDKGDTEGLRDYIDNHCPSICGHVDPKNPSTSMQRHLLWVQPPELKAGATDARHFKACYKSVRSCTVCMMDYCIDICWKGETKGWAIALQAYYEVGTARSPYDWEWKSMRSVGQPGGSPRWTQPTAKAPGIVRQRWLSAHGEPSELRGQWVMKHRYTALGV